VLALNGATAGSLISYIYPAAIFLSVTHYREEMRTVAKVRQQDVSSDENLWKGIELERK